MGNRGRETKGKKVTRVMIIKTPKVSLNKSILVTASSFLKVDRWEKTKSLAGKTGGTRTHKPAFCICRFVKVEKALKI